MGHTVLMKSLQHLHSAKAELLLTVDILVTVTKLLHCLIVLCGDAAAFHNIVCPT